MNRTPQIQFLDVPYAEKERAKALGACWDPQLKKWYVPSGRDPRPFQRWMPAGGTEQATVIAPEHASFSK